MKLKAAFFIMLCILVIGSVTRLRAQQAILKLPDAVLDKSYNQNVPAALRSEWHRELASDGPLQWRKLPGFPVGLDIDAAGNIYGTPQIVSRPRVLKLQVVDAKTGSQLMVLQVSLRVVKESPNTPGTEQSGIVLRPIQSTPPATGPSGVKVDVPDFTPQKRLKLPLSIKSHSPVELAIFVKDKDGNETSDSPYKKNVSAGDVRTFVILEMPVGQDTIKIKDAADGTLYKELKVEISAEESPAAKDKTPAARDEGSPGIELKHDGVVSSDATTTKITVHVTDVKLKKILVTAKPAEGSAGKSTYEIETKAGTQDYDQLITLANGATKISARDASNEDAKSAQLTINRKEISEKIKVTGSKLIDRSALTAPLTVNVFDPAIGKVKLIVLAKGQEKEERPAIFYDAIVECGSADKEGCPSEVRLPDGKDSSVYLVDVTGVEDVSIVNYAYWKTENAKAASVTDKRATAVIAFLRKGDAAVAQFPYNSLNTRAILGFEQAGASSSPSTSKPFLDFFFNAPLRSRVSLWGDIRLAVIPQQASAFGVFPTTAVNQITEANLSNLTQGFDFLVGPEFRLGTGKLTWSLIPGVKQKISAYIYGAFGAISPLDPKQQENIQIFVAPATTSPQYEEFQTRFPDAAASGKSYIAFTLPERDRFLRQFYGGFRFKTHFFNGNGIINRFPAIFDVALGRNEAVTGGRLKHAVLRLEGFYPLPIKESSFIYLYGTAMMKIGGGGVNIQKPLFLDTPGSAIGLSSPELFIIPNRQNNSDYYRIGVGIDLMRLFNQKPKSQ
jgi:hypothetical protein